MSDNPYAGIGDACNNFASWQGSEPVAPIDLVESIKQMFEMEQQREEDDRKRMIAWGRKWERFRKRDPRRYDATIQAMIEEFGGMGDPLNPILVHPKQVARYEARLKELLTPKPKEQTKP